MGSIDRRSFLRAAALGGLASLSTHRGASALTSGEAFQNGAPGRLRGASPLGAGDFPLRPVPLERVRITDGFWRPRMDVNRTVSLPYCFEKFGAADGSGDAKLIEAAAFMLIQRPDPDLEDFIDARIDGIVANLDRRIRTPEQSVRAPMHLFEAAAAYHRATGKRKLLDKSVQLGDWMDEAYGPGGKAYIAGHEGVEMGLVALSRATGDDRYWKLAKRLTDERGMEGYPRSGEYAIDRTYAQDQEPVIEQTEVVGHCVRAMFLYIAMTDVAALSGSEAYRRALDALWHDMVYHKTYLSGGIGSIRFHEQFGAPYELPNLSAWSETCASYGSVVWNHKMFLLEQDGRYADVMERTLYNALHDGVSLSGDRFFYQNPLESFGDYERFEWINVPCCPPNAVRMIASVGRYMYATDAMRELWVNLFIQSEAETPLGGVPVKLRQETHYPYDGTVRIHVDPSAQVAFAMNVRIPGWARGEVMPGDLYRYVDAEGGAPELRVNGQVVPLELSKGYARLERTWRPGDIVELELPMPVRRVLAHPDVKDDVGRVALERGPLVYCAEWPDNDGHALDLVVPEDAKLGAEFRPDLLGGVQVVTGQVRAIESPRVEEAGRTVARGLVAIPYWAWSNRGMGEMAVWMARDPRRAWLAPALPRGVADVRTSGGVEKTWTGYNDQNSYLSAVYDGREPISSADESSRYFRMRPPVGERAWIEYRFREPTRISSSRVYWFDDKRFTKMPESWRIVVRDGDAWTPVAAKGAYDVRKDAWSDVAFVPVTTTAVRIEVEPQTTSYKAGEIGPPAAMFISEDIQWRELGVLEWEVA
jgi:hypothetical protein